MPTFEDVAESEVSKVLVEISQMENDLLGNTAVEILSKNETVVLLAGAHPFETAGSWITESVLSFAKITGSAGGRILDALRDPNALNDVQAIVYLAQYLSVVVFANDSYDLYTLTVLATLLVRYFHKQNGISPTLKSK